jgi:hypothetical protein
MRPRLTRALLQQQLLTQQLPQVLDLLRRFPLWCLLLHLAHVYKKVSVSLSSILTALFDMV